MNQSRIKERNSKILNAKKLYDETHNMAMVGRRMGLSRERVRQLLSLGEKYELFVHVRYSPRSVCYKEKLLEVKKLYDKTRDVNKVAGALGVCKTRVYQYLREGEKHGLFEHVRYEMLNLSKRRREKIKKVLGLYNKTHNLREIGNALDIPITTVRRILFENKNKPVTLI